MAAAHAPALALACALGACAALGAAYAGYLAGQSTAARGGHARRLGGRGPAEEEEEEAEDAKTATEGTAPPAQAQQRADVRRPLFQRGNSGLLRELLASERGGEEAGEEDEEEDEEDEEHPNQFEFSTSNEEDFALHSQSQVQQQASNLSSDETSTGETTTGSVNRRLGESPPRALPGGGGRRPRSASSSSASSSGQPLTNVLETFLSTSYPPHRRSVDGELDDDEGCRTPILASSPMRSGNPSIMRTEIGRERTVTFAQRLGSEVAATRAWRNVAFAADSLVEEAEEAEDEDGEREEGETTPPPPPPERDAASSAPSPASSTIVPEIGRASASSFIFHSTQPPVAVPPTSRHVANDHAVPGRSRAVVALQDEADAIPFRRLTLTPEADGQGVAAMPMPSHAPAGASTAAAGPHIATGMLPHDSLESMQGCFLLKEMLKLRSKYLWMPLRERMLLKLHVGLRESLARDGGLPREPRMDINPFWAFEKNSQGDDDEGRSYNKSNGEEGGEGRVGVARDDGEDDGAASPPPRDDARVYQMVEGVFHVFDESTPVSARSWTTAAFAPPVATAGEFFKDFHTLLHAIQGGAAVSFAERRLLYLEETFRLHRHLNSDKEFLTQKACPHRDFYNVRKVDTHVHHTACMNQKHLLRFIKRKLKEEKASSERGEEARVVITRDGRGLTLHEVFHSIGLTAYDLNIDLLDMHAHSQRNATFHRFDKFNLKYNPLGQSRLREVFLKYDNEIAGHYLAQITREVFSDLCANKYVLAEYRVSIYGRDLGEWDKLAEWVVDNSLSCENVCYHIQVPRLFNVYHANGILGSFEEMLRNIFEPLFEVSRDPSSHPKLHRFLQQVVSFDSVDDESKVERRVNKTHNLTPGEWRSRYNPSYAYYLWYMHANLYALNQYREARGLTTFSLRPHCGEAGDIDHLCVGFLLAESIAHGIHLRKNPGLQYLYYLAQVGLHVSPLSNNSLFLDYHKNPFPTFFERGLNVSLSTDDPLQIHLTKEPLVEEFAVAAQVWKLSSCDMCEIARNSVVQSGFPAHLKRFWLGDARAAHGGGHGGVWPCWYDGLADGDGNGRDASAGGDDDAAAVRRCCFGTGFAPCDWGNDVRQTNVPDVRLQYRADAHRREVVGVLRSARCFNDTR